VLVVDADPEITALLCDLFAALGFGRAIAAPSGEVARAILADRSAPPVDLVVADIAVASDPPARPTRLRRSEAAPASPRREPLRRGEGPRATLTDWIRGHARSPNRYLPVIVLADASDLEAAVGLRKRGATEVLAKPVTVDSLCAVLEALIEAPRRFVETRSYFGPDRRRHVIPYRGGERRDAPRAS